MKVALGLGVHLYTKFLYETVNLALEWSSWVTVSQAALEELSFGRLLLGHPSRVLFGLFPWRFAFIWLQMPVMEHGVVCCWECPISRCLSRPKLMNSSPSRRQSSTLRKLLGVLGSLHSFIPLCQGAEVFIHTDSQNVVFIQHRGSRKTWLNEVAKRLFWLCMEHQIVLHVNWVPRDLYQLADDVSKLIDPSDWRLHPGLFDFLDTKWGPHSIDLFASSRNTHCERFFSRYWCPGSRGVDAFSHDWSQENSWINPF